MTNVVATAVATLVFAVAIFGVVGVTDVAAAVVCSGFSSNRSVGWRSGSSCCSAIQQVKECALS